jgi:hypothetical protein
MSCPSVRNRPVAEIWAQTLSPGAVTYPGPHESATRRVFVPALVNVVLARSYCGSSYRRGRWRCTGIAEIPTGAS